MDAINPQDVESVSVLKDASSSAVYGARGAFGVVLITTKSAKKGTPVINYNGSVTINRRTVTPDVVTDGLTWINWWKDCYNGYYNGSKALLNHVDSTIPYTETIYQELIRRSQDPSLARTTALSGHDQFGWAYYDSTDWHSLFYKDYNWSTEHNLSISGGGDQADYYISGRFYDMDGIYKVGNDSYKKYDVRAKGTLKVRPWLRLTNNMSVSVIDAYEPKHQKNNSQIPRLINHTAMPLSPVKNPDGTWTAAAAKSGYAAFSEGTSWRTNDYVYLRNKFDVNIDLVKDVLTASAGEAIMAHRFLEYQPWKGDIDRRTNGSLIAMEAGTAYAYAIDKLQDRGRFFIFPQEEVYAGQVVGENAKDNDIVVNVTKSKKLTNMRASGADDKARIVPPVIFSLEEALEYIKEDEYVEVTPHHLRLRKIILDETERKRANR